MPPSWLNQFSCLSLYFILKSLFNHWKLCPHRLIGTWGQPTVVVHHWKVQPRSRLRGRQSLAVEGWRKSPKIIICAIPSLLFQLDLFVRIRGRWYVIHGCTLFMSEASHQMVIHQTCGLHQCIHSCWSNKSEPPLHKLIAEGLRLRGFHWYLFGELVVVHHWLMVNKTPQEFT